MFLTISKRQLQPFFKPAKQNQAMMLGMILASIDSIFFFTPLRLILFHLECPDIGKIVLSCDSAYYIRILAHPADADNLFCKILPLNSEKRLTKPPSFGMITDVAKDRLWTCGCSSMVEFQPSKLVTWVRFPSPAPRFACASSSAG